MPNEKSTKLKIRTFAISVLTVACLLYFFMYRPAVEAGRTFIWLYDGLYQHYIALEAYRRYVLGIIESIRNGHLVIPQWSFAMGEGADIVNTLHYHVFGDPLSLLSLLYSEADLWKCYGLLFFIKILIGAAGFVFACFEFGQKRTVPVLCGVLSYTFCSWTVYSVMRHPNYLVPVMWFPFFILAAERVISKNKGVLLAICCFLCGITNFYWFYNIAVFTAIYTIVRSGCLRKNVKGVFTDILHVAIPAVIGTLMSAFILYPVIRYVLTNSRLSQERTIDLFYTPIYYLDSLCVVTDACYIGSEFMLGFTWPALIVAFLELKDFVTRKNKSDPIGIFLIISLLFFIFPIFSQILEGGDYPCGKWTWALMFLTSLTLTLRLPRIFFMTSREKLSIILFAVILIVIKINIGFGFAADIASIVLILISGIVKKTELKELIIFTSVFISAVFYCSTNNTHHIFGLIPFSDEYVNFATLHNENDAHYLAKNYDDVTRYSGQTLYLNAGLSAGLSSTETYWSLTPPELIAARKKLEVASTEFMNFKIEGYDARPDLLALSATNYYLTRTDEPRGIPYGFEIIEENAPIITYYRDIESFREKGNVKLFDTYNVYKNENALPLLYAYTDTTTEEQINDSVPLAISETMLTTAITDRETSLSRTPPETTEQKIPCTFSFDQTVDENGICKIETDEGAKEYKKYFTVHTDTIPGTEVYLRLKGIREYSRKAKELGIDESHELRLPESGALMFSTDTGSKNFLRFSPGINNYYDGQEDFLINLGVQNDSVSTITVSVVMDGYYEIDDVEVWCRSIDNFPKSVYELKNNADIDYAIGVDQVSGTITCNNNVFLCFAENYSEHWKAYVDDVEAPVYRTNLHYIGVEVPKGSHSIRFVYDDANKKIGLMISIFGLLLFAAMLLTDSARVFPLRGSKPRARRIADRC